MSTEGRSRPADGDIVVCQFCGAREGTFHTEPDCAHTCVDCVLRQRDEARAEVEAIHDLLRERESLLGTLDAEMAAKAAYKREVERLRAEVKRLKSGGDCVAFGAQQEIDTLRTRAEAAERERDEALARAEQGDVDLGVLREHIDQQEEQHLAESGLLSDLCDLLFGDETRAETHGYDGVLDRARDVLAERDSAKLRAEGQRRAWCTARRSLAYVAQHAPELADEAEEAAAMEDLDPPSILAIRAHDALWEVYHLLRSPDAGDMDERDRGEVAEVYRAARAVLAFAANGDPATVIWAGRAWGWAHRLLYALRDDNGMGPDATRRHLVSLVEDMKEAAREFPGIERSA